MFFSAAQQHTSLCYLFCALTAAVACVCLVNRLESDSPRNDHKLLAEYQRRPQVLAARFIKSRLYNNAL